MSISIFRPNRRSLLLGATALALPLVAQSPVFAAARPAPLAPGRDLAFDLDWRFFRGEGDFAAPDVDDGAWRRVDLPHDWSIEDVPGPISETRFGPFDKSAVGGTGTGFTVGGEGWYRKRFSLAGVPSDARIEILFDGVAVVSDVWINGHALGTHENAYTAFVHDLTPYLNRGGENVIAVRARNLGVNSRWYVGSGIYRSVTLDILPAAAGIARWGVTASTRRIEGKRALVEVSTRLDRLEDGLVVRTVLKDARGRIAAEAVAPATAEMSQTLVLNDARLWSPADPHLHTLETTLMRGRRVLDRATQTFGVRIVTMDAAQGLRINGEPLTLKGGCVHHDNGLLGAATFADADDRRVRLHKARGYNAFRSSHNPAAKTFLEACDRHGMLVIEEAFDVWHVRKRTEDYATYFQARWREDLVAMVNRARNHPSVIMWSIGNEIPERNTAEGREWSWKLANEVRTLDPTRPVTAGLQEFLGRPITAVEGTARAGQAGKLDQPSSIFLDVAGYNYKLPDIEPDHLLYPERIIYASESYPSDAYDYWAMTRRAPYFLGEFVWTSMDYIGEAGVGLTMRVPEPAPPYVPVDFPIMNAYCGDIDLIGDSKPQSRYRDVVWGVSALELLVQRPLEAGEVERIPLWGWSDELESWTWPGKEGQPLAVRIYTSGDRIQTILNGAVIDDRAVTEAEKMRAEVSAPYAPGVLEVVAFRDGVELARKRLETVDAAAALALRAEGTLARDRGALCYVHVDVSDATGRLSPDAMVDVALAVEGPAELIGFGSANPRAVGSFQSTSARTFHGRALAILRSTGGAGTVRIQAQAGGLRSAGLNIPVRR